ncbi:MAG TPA: molybdopterin molybdotransferase MoeA [Promineifilum sp.]|nr:molybdopterin molybdotransferase MoeA [Promineifilum sp.]HRO89281.1 molybdopterin molybdotransferase MoeA [Promineifilum sp.]HRQ13392.1 molybdopterin molybdotransferase MoeA [Promineifilum sp.]
MAKQEDLSVREALNLILGTIDILSSEELNLFDGLGRVLAQSVTAHDSLPPFANSSMDGYAVRAEDVGGAREDRPIRLKVIGDIAAGAGILPEVIAGTAARIMTGAPLPPGADAVVPVEDTDEPWRGKERPLPEFVAIHRAVGPGDFTRHPGEDIRAGDIVLEKGCVLRPQEIGILAALGVGRINVIRRPRVGVLATGDELVDVASPLTPGKIRNSNGYAQTAQVAALGGVPVMLGVAGDTEAAVRERLDAGVAAGVDLLISSAGVSVGAYDVVKAVLDEVGDVAFWRVRMRPGKPLAFGSYRGTPFLGVPGNPVSAMVSFEMFARPAILKMAGHDKLERPRVEVTILEDIDSDGRESYIRAVVTRDERGYLARTTGGQGSHMMTSLVKANALLVVPEGVKAIQAGTKLKALMIDWSGGIF